MVQCNQREHLSEKVKWYEDILITDNGAEIDVCDFEQSTVNWFQWNLMQIDKMSENNI